jgi:hypothetical protein
MTSLKILLSFIILASLSLIYSCSSADIKTEAAGKESKNPVVQHIQSDLKGITISVTYDTSFMTKVYEVESGSTLPDTSKYVVERGADKGVIRFACTGEVVKKYIITPNKITAVIKTKYDMSIYDKTDYVFTKDSLYVINTTHTDGGIFTSSTISVLPSLDSKFEYQEYLLSVSSVCMLNKKLFLQVLDFCSRNDIKY